MNTIARQSLKRERCDELGCRLRHHNAHLGARLNKEAGEFGAFVGSNTAGNAEQDAFVRQA